MTTETPYPRYELPKNKTETLVVERQPPFKGHELVDLRLWFTNAQGQLQPTTKGFKLKPAVAKQLLHTLQYMADTGQLDDEVG